MSIDELALRYNLTDDEASAIDAECRRMAVETAHSYRSAIEWFACRLDALQKLRDALLLDAAVLDLTSQSTS